MRAVNIVGFKNSGKTTLTLELAQTLEKRGLSVALVKHSHNTLDAPHSDTGRFRTPHSGRSVLALGQGEAALFWGQEKKLTDLLPLLQADIVLIEGAKSQDFLPRILCLRPEDIQKELDPQLQGALALASYSMTDLAPTCVHGKPHFNQLNPHTLEQLATIIQEKAFALPRLHCGSCGLSSCAHLARAVVAQEKSLKDCPVLQGKVQLQVNGKNIALNPFTARIMAAAVGGMVQELKGVEDSGKLEQNIQFYCTF